MGSAVWLRIAALSLLPTVALCACASPSPPTPAAGSAAAPRVIRTFVGIPMPPNNVLDVDRTVVVGGDSDWLGRIFFAAPMTVDQAIDFFRRDMPRFGWTELAVTRSGTSVLAYQMANRMATIELTRQANGAGTQVEFWVNPVPARDSEQAAQPAEPLVQAPTSVPSSFPQQPVDRQVIQPPPRAVEQAPLPPPSR